MKTKSIKYLPIHHSFLGGAILTAAACLAFCALSARAQTVTFGFQKGNLTTNSVVYDAGYNVVDGVLNDGSVPTLSSTPTAAIGSFFKSGSPNGQQNCGFFSYDLTQLANFITANTSGNSSVSISAASFSIIANAAGSTAGGNYAWALYGTDPFTSSCTWSNYDGVTPWTTPPYQNLSSPNNTVLFGYTGGGSALTPSLNTNSIFLNGVSAGNPLTLGGGTNFINAITNALARGDKTLYLTLRIPSLVNGDSRQTLIFSPTNTVASRPLLRITANVNVTASYSTWTGGSGTSWATAGNWSPSGVPSAGAFISFNNLSTANLGTVLNQDFSVNSISVTNPTGPVSIGGGNSLAINSASGIDLSAATQDLTISAPVVLGANQTWDVGASRTLTIGGAVTGSGNLTIAGAGKVSLSAANVLPNGPTAGSLTLNGTLDLNGTSQTMKALTGSGVVDNTAGGAVTLTLTNDSNVTFSGTIQNAGGALALVKTGAGTATLSVANTYSGGTTISGGALKPGNADALGTGTLTVNSGGILYPTAGMTITNAVTLSGGTLEIGGGNNNVLGTSELVAMTANSAIAADGGTYGVYINGGVNMGSGNYTLSSYNNNVGKGNQIKDITGANGTIINTGPGNLWIGGTNTFAGTFRAGSGPLIFQTAYALTNATLNMNAADSGAVNFGADVIIGALTGIRDLNLGTGANARTISIGNNNASTTYSGAMTNDGSVIKIGTGTLSLDGANTYSGLTTVSAGTLGGSGLISGPVTIEAGGTLAPGNSIGFLTINNNFTNAGTVFMELNAGSLTSDLVTGVVDASYGGSLAVSNLSGTSLAAGQTYQLFSASGTKTGNFTSVTLLGAGASGLTGTFNPATGQLTLANVVAAQPVINQFAVSAGQLILEGNNGTASGSYSILTSTDVALPLSSWTTNTTGTFTAGGAFSNAIPVTAEAQRFFLIKQP